MTGFFSIAGALLVMSLILFHTARLFFEYYTERREEKTRAKLTGVMSGKTDDPMLADKLMSGEVKLAEEASVFIPEPIESRERERRFDHPIASSLVDQGLGYLVRGYTTAEGCGIDVVLHDFVGGVDVLRRILIANDAPAETIIEYSSGDLPIYS